MRNDRKYQKLDAIVLKAMRGDRNAFDKLCEMQAPYVIYSCIKQMGNTHDGEDAAQEVFVRLQEKIGNLKTPESFVSWMRVVIASVCKRLKQNYMNHTGTIPIDDLADLFSEEDVAVLPEEYLNEKEKGKALMRLIDNLPDQVRTCVLMHYFNEMKISEIASSLEITEGSVKGYLYVGREKIRKTLKAQDEKSYMHSSSLLPMTAFSRLYKREMQETITPATIRRCLDSVGAKGSSLMPSLPASTVKTILLAAVCTAAVVTAIAGYSYLASAPLVDVPPVPQQAIAGMTSGSEDMATENGATQPEVSQPGLPPSGPGGATPGTGENPDGPRSVALEADKPTPAIPPGKLLPNAVATSVKGRMTIADFDGVANPGQLFSNQFYATIGQNGETLDLANVAGDGSFEFVNLAIAHSGQYTLQIHSIHGQGLAFSAGNPGGTFVIDLVPGQPYALPEPIYVTDNESPVVALSVLDEGGELTGVNPSQIRIDINDITKTTTAWEIRQGEGTAAVLTGTTENIDSQTLDALPSGAYTLVVTVTDALGNQTTVTSQFYIKRT